MFLFLFGEPWDCSSPKLGVQWKRATITTADRAEGPGEQAKPESSGLYGGKDSCSLCQSISGDFLLSSQPLNPRRVQAALRVLALYAVQPSEIGRRWFRQCTPTFPGSAWVMQLSARNRPRTLPATMSAQLAAGTGVQAVTHRHEHHSLKAGEEKRGYARV